MKRSDAFRWLHRITVAAEAMDFPGKSECATLAWKMDEVSAFSRKWGDLLGSDVGHIQMADAMRMEGAFKGWNGKESMRDELLVECAKLAQSESARLIVSVMDKNDFLSLAQTQKERLKNPVYGGF